MKADLAVGATWWRHLWLQLKTLPLMLVEGLLGIPVSVCLPMVQYVFSVALRRLFSAQADRDSFAYVRSPSLAEASV